MANNGIITEVCAIAQVLVSADAHEDMCFEDTFLPLGDAEEAEERTLDDVVAEYSVRMVCRWWRRCGRLEPPFLWHVN